MVARRSGPFLFGIAERPGSGGPGERHDTEQRGVTWYATRGPHLAPQLHSALSAKTVWGKIASRGVSNPRPAFAVTVFVRLFAGRARTRQVGRARMCGSQPFRPRSAFVHTPKIDFEIFKI